MPPCQEHKKYSDRLEKLSFWLIPSPKVQIPYHAQLYFLNPKHKILNPKPYV